MAVENVGIGDHFSWATGLWTYAKQPQGSQMRVLTYRST